MSCHSQPSLEGGRGTFLVEGEQVEIWSRYAEMGGLHKQFKDKFC